MRHRHANWHLNRNSTHRIALFRNLSRALITHERITTTVAKAKALRPFIEKIITLAKKASLANDGTPEGKAKSLHFLRLAIAKLGPNHGTGVYLGKGDPDPVHKTLLKKLMNEIGPRYKDRPGGYTRILKIHTRRLGDGGEQAIIELLQAGETKATKPAAAPALAPVPAPQN